MRIKQTTKSDTSKKDVVTTTQEVPSTGKSPDAVIYHGNRHVRTYSKEVHGKDYLDLAKQYLDQYPAYTLR